MSSIDINLGEIILSTARFDSENEMRARISELGRGLVLVTEEVGNNSILLRVRHHDGRWKTNCGIVFGGPIQPQIAIHEKFSCWIAFDDLLFIVSFREPECIAKIKLDSSFYSLVSLHSGSVAVIHELGVLCFDSRGEKLWSITGPGIIVSYRIEDNQVVCQWEDGTASSYRLSNGTPA